MVVNSSVRIVNRFEVCWFGLVWFGWGFVVGWLGEWEENWFMSVSRSVVCCMHVVVVVGGVMWAIESSYGYDGRIVQLWCRTAGWIM